MFTSIRILFLFISTVLATGQEPGSAYPATAIEASTMPPVMDADQRDDQPLATPGVQGKNAVVCANEQTGVFLAFSMCSCGENKRTVVQTIRQLQPIGCLLILPFHLATTAPSVGHDRYRKVLMFPRRKRT
jgi:hypothetical protein